MKLSKLTVMMVSLLSGGFFSGAVSADMTINMSGEFIMPQCTINNGAPVEVDFGILDVKNFTTANEPVRPTDFNVPLDCPYTVGLPKMTITGNAHSAAEGSLQTTKYAEGLVVYLRHKGGGAPIVINSPVDASSSITGDGNIRTLTLNAAVGLHTLGSLTPGPYTATASLQVIYE